jgi:MFS transporter, FHS family, L-fucose permease
MNNKSSILKILPVLFSFFVMGFVDVVGISANYVKADFGLSDTMANFLPMMVFIWFAVFSVPAGILVNRIGRKNTVLISMIITITALFIPLVSYSYSVVLFAFALLGIGNTILQVSLNPLVSNVVNKNKLTSFLTLGQFVKAIASFSGPLIAGFAALSLGNWKLLFPIFAGITIISSGWLWVIPIKKDEKIEKVYSFKSSYSLLLDKHILLLFLGILAIVGIDVGMNISSPKLLMERTNLELERAGLGTSLYFAARTVGTLIGAFVLSKVSAVKFMKLNMLAAILTTFLMLFIQNVVILFILIALIGFTIANVFSIIFSVALQWKPTRANEISGLMIMGVSGGALLPPIIGVFTDHFGQTGGIIVILTTMIYLLFLSIKFQQK